MPARITQTCASFCCGKDLPCPDHGKRTRSRSEETRQRHLVYSTQRWRRVRKLFLMQHPLCAKCLPRAEAAVDVHHKVALRDGGRPFDFGNLEGLCKADHARATLAEEAARRPASVMPGGGLISSSVDDCRVLGDPRRFRRKFRKGGGGLKNDEQR